MPDNPTERVVRYFPEFDNVVDHLLAELFKRRPLEEPPLDAAAEALVLLEPAVAMFERHAAVALERAPTGGQ